MKTKTLQTSLATIFAVFLCACGVSRQEVPQGESLQDIAHDAFIYAYPMMEQVKIVNGMQKFMGTEFNKVTMNPKLPWENVGQPIVAPNLTSMTGGVLCLVTGVPRLKQGLCPLW